MLDDAVEAEQAEQQRLAEDHSETLRALRSQAASTAEVLMSALDSERQQVATLEVSPPPPESQWQACDRLTSHPAVALRSSTISCMWVVCWGQQIALRRQTANAEHTAARHPLLW